MGGGWKEGVRETVYLMELVMFLPCHEVALSMCAYIYIHLSQIGRNRKKKNLSLLKHVFGDIHFYRSV